MVGAHGTTLGLLSLALCGCAAGDRDAGDVAVTDSAGVAIVENRTDTAALPVWAVVAEPTLDIGVVDGAPEYQLFRALDGLRLPDGGVVVANAGTQELRFYDARGRFLRAQGGEGEGPGEYRFPFRILRLPGDSLLVYDLGLARFSVLDPRGDYVRGFRPARALLNEPQVAGLIGDSIAVLHETIFDIPAAGFDTMYARAAFIALDGSGADSLMLPDRRMGRIGEGGRSLVGSPHFEPWARFAAAPYGLWAGDARAPEVRLYGPDRALRAVARWSAEPRPVTDADIARRMDLMLDGAPAQRARELRAMYSQVPAADAMPFYDALEVDRAGRLWLRTFAAPGDAGPRTWLVFEADGRLAARAALPPSLVPFEIGGDYVLGAVRDELEVEHVRLWRLTRGGDEQD